MALRDFIEGLINEGIARVPGQLDSFGDDDTAVLLQQQYDHTVAEAPDGLPPFDRHAALWAARYLYRAVQLLMLRQLGEEVVKQHLTSYEGKISPAVVYSIDLSFRHLPALIRLAKGLAPGDILVLQLKEQARQWPFSAVGVGMEGIAVEGGADTVVPSDEALSLTIEDPCLQQLYVDRIIQEKDMQLARDERILPFVTASLGEHASTLWPGFKTKDLHGKGKADSGQDK